MMAHVTPSDLVALAAVFVAGLAVGTAVARAVLLRRGRAS